MSYKTAWNGLETYVNKTIKEYKDNIRKAMDEQGEYAECCLIMQHEYAVMKKHKEKNERN